MEHLADLSRNWPDGDSSAGHLRIPRRVGIIYRHRGKRSSALRFAQRCVSYIRLVNIISYLYYIFSRIRYYL